METTETIEVNNQQNTEISSKPNFELLSNDDFLNQEVKIENDKKEEIKQDVSTKEEKVEDVIEKEITLNEEPKEENKDNVSEKVDENVEELKEIPLTLDDITEKETLEGSWIEYAKAEGLEINEDTPEAYIQAKIEPIQKQLQELDSKKMEDYFHNLDPKTRMEIELQQSGMTLEEINAPLENISRYRNLTPVELYREDLTAKIEQVRELTETDKSWIDAEIEKKVESGDIEHEATRIRLDLDTIEKSILSERQQIIEKYKANKDNYIIQKEKEQNESVIKSLSEIKEFIGSSIAPEIKQELTLRYNNGKYDQLLKDPNMIAKFIAFNELGEKAIKNLEAKSYNKGKLEITNKMHNIPPLTTGASGVSMTDNEKLNFERLKSDFGS